MLSIIKTMQQTIVAFSIAVLLSGCGGTKVLKEPEPLEIGQPIIADSDERVAVVLDWVIVRDGPGTWAKNADWDEYLLRIQNVSERPVEIRSVTVLDSSLTSQHSVADRKRLVRATRETARRYEDEGVEVKAGTGATTLVAVGGISASVGMGAGAAAMYGSGAALGATAGALLLAPVLITNGIVRGVNNGKVNKEIGLRQSMLPRTIAAGEVAALNLFFPIAPSPASVEVAYADADGEYVLAIDTTAPLDGLHLPKDDR
ncbi:MAG: hypothetical protein QNJ00_17600 [Woeseiaceae bacterium]|nr:hypothetical protein [Woeseiaceae bacterium]